MPQSTVNCDYSLIQSNIHQLLIKTSTRQTIEDLFTIFRQINDEFPEQQIVTYLLDASKTGELPYRYLAQRAQQWNKENPNVPPSRVAILFPMGMLANMFNVLIKQLSTSQAQTRLFGVDKRDEAIQWLIQD